MRFNGYTQATKKLVAKKLRTALYTKGPKNGVCA